MRHRTQPVPVSNPGPRAPGRHHRWRQENYKNPIWFQGWRKKFFAGLINRGVRESNQTPIQPHFDANGAIDSSATAGLDRAGLQHALAFEASTFIHGSLPLTRFSDEPVLASVPDRPAGWAASVLRCGWRLGSGSREGIFLSPVTDISSRTDLGFQLLPALPGVFDQRDKLRPTKRRFVQRRLVNSRSLPCPKPVGAKVNHSAKGIVNVNFGSVDHQQSINSKPRKRFRRNPAFFEELKNPNALSLHGT